MTEYIKSIKFQRLNPKPLIDSSMINLVDDMVKAIKITLNENYSKSLSLNCDKKYHYLSEDELDEFLQLRKIMKGMSMRLKSRKA